MYGIQIHVSQYIYIISKKVAQTRNFRLNTHTHKYVYTHIHMHKKMCLSSSDTHLGSSLVSFVVMHRKRISIYMYIYIILGLFVKMRDTSGIYFNVSHSDAWKSHMYVRVYVYT